MIRSKLSLDRKEKKERKKEREIGETIIHSLSLKKRLTALPIHEVTSWSFESSFVKVEWSRWSYYHIFSSFLLLFSSFFSFFFFLSLLSFSYVLRTLVLIRIIEAYLSFPAPHRLLKRTQWRRSFLLNNVSTFEKCFLLLIIKRIKETLLKVVSEGRK